MGHGDHCEPTGNLGKARPEVVLPTHHSGERRESGLAGGLLGRFRGEGSSPLSLWSRELVTT